MESLNVQIEEARRRLERRDALKAQLPMSREEIGHARYRRDCVEHALGRLREDIEVLSSFTIGSFFDTLFGRREHKLNERKREAEELQEQFDECDRAVTELEGNLRRIEAELADLITVDQEYRALRETKRKTMLQSNAPGAARLVESSARLEESQDQQRALRKALETGEHLMDRLLGMSRAVGRTQRKMRFRSPLGMVGQVVQKACARQGAKYSIELVRDGLRRFSQAISAIPFPSEPDKLDREIIRLSAVMQDHHAQLGGSRARTAASGAGGVIHILEEVRTTVGFLQEKWERVNPEVESLRAECDELIEQA